MTEYVKWMPYTHGDQPPHWTKDMLASVDEDGEKVNADWAWLAWSTYYVPYEAVHGKPFEADLIGDPLAAALAEISGEGGFDNFNHQAYRLRSALADKGLEIVERGSHDT